MPPRSNNGPSIGGDGGDGGDAVGGNAIGGDGGDGGDAVGGNAIGGDGGDGGDAVGGNAIGGDGGDGGDAVGLALVEPICDDTALEELVEMVETLLMVSKEKMGRAVQTKLQYVRLIEIDISNHKLDTKD